MRQKLLRVLLVEHLHLLVEVVHDLREAEILIVPHAVAFAVDASDVEVQVRVDAAFLQLGDEVVERVQLLRIELARVVPTPHKQAR